MQHILLNISDDSALGSQFIYFSVASYSMAWRSVAFHTVAWHRAAVVRLEARPRSNAGSTYLTRYGSITSLSKRAQILVANELCTWLCTFVEYAICARFVKLCCACDLKICTP